MYNNILDTLGGIFKNSREKKSNEEPLNAIVGGLIEDTAEIVAFDETIFDSRAFRFSFFSGQHKSIPFIEMFRIRRGDGRTTATTDFHHYYCKCYDHARETSLGRASAVTHVLRRPRSPTLP